jgi:intraflagellar transport protein 74
MLEGFSLTTLSSQESLRSNETYRQISHMEEKLNDLMKDNKLMQRIVDELNAVSDLMS